MEYEVIICFETHVELNTETKLFCDCSTRYGASPNSQICPVCTGQPGSLPVLNRKAVELGIRAGLALNCDINRQSRFARKNYFYPDLPKGYQISQYERPLCENGYLEITGDDGNPYRVGIKRIHLEEDAGKLVHSSSSFEASEYSLVDYNRSSVPLLEIVADHTRNPICSVREARDCLEKMKQILKYLEVSECSLEKGQFRCDVNVSIRTRGSRDLGNRSEIKNMASFKHILDALQYEIRRQSEILKSGGEIFQETRLYDEQNKITTPMRTKEDAPDYRYFPDPDLVEIEIDKEFIQEIEASMPELPEQRLVRLTERFGIPIRDAERLIKDKSVSDFFESCAPHCDNTKTLNRWITRDLFRLLNDSGLTMEQCPIRPIGFSQLINLIERGDTTNDIGKTVLEEMFKTGRDPASIIEQNDLKPIDDTAFLEKILDEVETENPDAVTLIRRGETKPIDYLIGQVMRKTQGKAHAKRVRELIQKLLAP